MLGWDFPFLAGKQFLVSRFFKSAAFPILIVVVLAFFAQKLISPGDREKVPTYSEFLDRGRPGKVKSVTINTKDNTLDVEPVNERREEVRDGLPGQHRAVARRTAA